MTLPEEVFRYFVPARLPHPDDILERLRAARVELELAVSRWQLSGDAANDDTLLDVQTAAAQVARLALTVAVAVRRRDAKRPKQQPTKGDL